MNGDRFEHDAGGFQPQGDWSRPEHVLFELIVRKELDAISQNPRFRRFLKVFQHAGARDGWCPGTVVLRGSVVARDSVTIAEGTFFNTTGEKIDVTQEDWADTVKAP